MIIAKDKKVCFVITPIGDNNSDIRRHIDGIIDQAIIPALDKKYDVVVAHRKYEIGSINERVIRSVFDADLVIANLTNTNPNVMYELAVRYSFGKPAIVIAEKGTKLPFDVIDENTIFYVNDPTGSNDLKLAIIEYEKNIDYYQEGYGPVYKVINKIPLYNEVESGKDVSNDSLLRYVIDRLDSLETNLNVKTQNEPRKNMNLDLTQELAIVFSNSQPFEDNEVYEILATIKTYAIGEVSFDREERHFEVTFAILSHMFMDLINVLEAWRNSREDAYYYIKNSCLV